MCVCVCVCVCVFIYRFYKYAFFAIYENLFIYNIYKYKESHVFLQMYIVVSVLVVLCYAVLTCALGSSFVVAGSSHV